MHEILLHHIIMGNRFSPRHIMPALDNVENIAYSIKNLLKFLDYEYKINFGVCITGIFFQQQPSSENEGVFKMLNPFLCYIIKSQHFQPIFSYSRKLEKTLDIAENFS